MAYFVETLPDGQPKPSSPVLTSSVGAEGKLIEITDDVERKFSGSGREEKQPRYYVKTNNLGVPQSGTLTSTRPSVGDFVDITRSYLAQIIQDPGLTDEDVLYAVLWVGNSIATNMSTQSPPASFVNESFPGNKKITWNAGLSAMEIADNILDQNGYDRLGEVKRVGTCCTSGWYNPAVLITNKMSEILKVQTGKDINFVSISGATNGALVDDYGGAGAWILNDNSVFFQYLRQGLETAVAYAGTIGKTLKVAFAVMTAGEWEVIQFNTLSMSAGKYRNQVSRYFSQLQQMVFEETGQTGVFPLFMTQTNLNTGTDAQNMVLKDAQLAQDSDLMPLAVPLYPISILANFEHPDTTAQFRIVGILANQILNRFYLSRWKAFKVKTATIDGNLITLDVQVPCKPLLIDTSRGVDTAHGFTLITGGSTEIAISSVQVAGEKILLTAASDPTGAVLYYKLKRPYVSSPDLTTRLTRAGSYIVDSANANFFGLYTPNYLLAFSLQL